MLLGSSACADSSSQADAQASSDEGSGCDAAEITDVLGRDEVTVDLCLDQWAYVVSDVPEDSAAFVRRVDGSWRDYDRQPRTRCRSEAEADGAPLALLEYFRVCDTTLGLRTPITEPACDGSGIVVLGAATTPGSYRDDVHALLERFPESSYLRTDMACASLNQETDAGERIYAVYRPAGDSRQSICAAVRNAGGDAYGTRLDESSDPEDVVDC